MDIIKRSRTIILILVCLLCPGFMQIASAAPKDLNAVRQEIRELERQLKAKEAKEKSLLEQLEDSERETGLIKKLISGLEDEIAIQNRQIRKTESQLSAAEEKQGILKNLVARRMVSMYKYNRLADWKAFLTFSNINQALVWVRYQKRIIQNDRRQLDQLIENTQTIIVSQTQLKTELQIKQQLVSENRSKSDLLVKKKDEQQSLLAEVRKSMEAEREKLRLKILAEKEIQDRIAQEALRKEQLKKPPPVKTGQVAFETLRGKLIWPSQGPIVTRYGKVKHPTLKTWTENLGIEIQAPAGGSVLNVCPGQVMSVFWMRSAGNIVIIDHGNNYYTVYSHLEVVSVQQGLWLEQGAEIGKVGDRQSLHQSRLEFQVWKGKDHLDPSVWLKQG
jgi:septal ring factor EnvC (AmiA/AmiB activator)